MAEPSAHGFGAPARRPVGRLGLVVLLALGVVALAVMTQAEAAAEAPETDYDIDPELGRQVEQFQAEHGVADPRRDKRDSAR